MSDSKSGVIRIYNCSNQMIPIQVRAPGSNFYANEQQVRIGAKKDVTLPKSHIYSEQIQNLQQRRMVKVTYDSES